jgi:hypothetical protein
MYYSVLQKVQHSSNDITEWVNWFLHYLKKAMLAIENKNFANLESKFLGLTLNSNWGKGNCI